MANQQDQINLLLQKLEYLTQKQATFSQEISELRQQIYQLKEGSATTFAPPQIKVKEQNSAIKAGELIEEYIPTPSVSQPAKTHPAVPRFQIPASIKTDWEKFIGENLISKIGILILVLGVGIGAKFSIDNNLINPLTRIVLGYLTGLGLLGIGIKLKPNYINYSAVLVSGAMAILYFITYFAYNFYGLIPQLVAFGLMLLFTIFTVIAAINYNQQVIALVGLVGAYGVPFLLGDGSGNIVTMFVYMAVLNIGILIIAFKKYWKGVHRAAFIMTWCIYAAWFFFDGNRTADFTVALPFAAIFFITFYVLFLAYKLLRKEQFVKRDIWLILTNSFLFYGFGYAILERHEISEQFLGLFTLANAGIHFIVATIIHRQKLADKNLFYLVIGLVLLFLTIAIPVQLDGNWVTLIWIGEAALLFWIGRTKGVPFYEKMAYPLIAVALLSLTEDWANYGRYYTTAPATRIAPIFNIYFLTSILFVIALGFINWINNQSTFDTASFKRKWIPNLLQIILPSALLVTLYLAFYLEIDNYFIQSYEETKIKGLKNGSFNLHSLNYDNDLIHFKSVWQINYTLLFLSALTFINVKWIKNTALAKVNLVLNGIGILLFLSAGLFALRALQQSYVSPDANALFIAGQFNITIRYISLLIFAGFLYLTYRYLKNVVTGFNLILVFDLVLHTTLLVVASSELIYWSEMGISAQYNKLGLSILWGIYALLLIGLGIWKRKQHLRLAAMALFGLTLVKLFFYDLTHLETIGKTIVLVSLGLLLLIISFLYNKYKHLIADEFES